MPTALSKTAHDSKTGMTLGELRQFIELAAQQGVLDTQHIKGRVNVRGGVRSLTIQDSDDRNT